MVPFDREAIKRVPNCDTQPCMTTTSSTHALTNAWKCPACLGLVVEAIEQQFLQGEGKRFEKALAGVADQVKKRTAENTMLFALVKWIASAGVRKDPDGAHSKEIVAGCEEALKATPESARFLEAFQLFQKIRDLALEMVGKVPGGKLDADEDLVRNLRHAILSLEAHENVGRATREEAG